MKLLKNLIKKRLNQARFQNHDLDPNQLLQVIVVKARNESISN